MLRQQAATTASHYPQWWPLSWWHDNGCWWPGWLMAAITTTTMAATSNGGHDNGCFDGHDGHYKGHNQPGSMMAHFDGSTLQQLHTTTATTMMTVACHNDSHCTDDGCWNYWDLLLQLSMMASATINDSPSNQPATINYGHCGWPTTINYSHCYLQLLALTAAATITIHDSCSDHQWWLQQPSMMATGSCNQWWWWPLEPATNDDDSWNLQPAMMVTTMCNHWWWQWLLQPAAINDGCCNPARTINEVAATMNYQWQPL